MVEPEALVFLGPEVQSCSPGFGFRYGYTGTPEVLSGEKVSGFKGSVVALGGSVSVRNHNP